MCPPLELVTLALVFARMAAPVAVASIVPALPVNTTACPSMPNKVPEIKPLVLLATVAMPVAWIALELTPVDLICPAFARTLTVAAIMAFPLAASASMKPALAVIVTVFVAETALKWPVMWAMAVEFATVILSLAIMATELGLDTVARLFTVAVLTLIAPPTSEVTVAPSCTVMVIPLPGLHTGGLRFSDHRERRERQHQPEQPQPMTCVWALRWNDRDNLLHSIPRSHSNVIAWVAIRAS